MRGAGPQADRGEDLSAGPQRVLLLARTLTPGGPIESVLRAPTLSGWSIEFLPTSLGGSRPKRAAFAAMAFARLTEVIHLFEPQILHLVVDGGTSAARKVGLARIGRAHGLRVLVDVQAAPTWARGPLRGAGQIVESGWPHEADAAAARLLRLWGGE